MRTIKELLDSGDFRHCTPEDFKMGTTIYKTIDHWRYDGERLAGKQIIDQYTRIVDLEGAVIQIQHGSTEDQTIYKIL